MAYDNTNVLLTILEVRSPAWVSRKLQRRITSLLAHRLEAGCILWLMAPSQRRHPSDLLFCPHIPSSCLSCLPLMHKDACDDAEPSWVIQDLLLVSGLLTSSHPPSPLCHRSARSHRLRELGCGHLAVTKRVLRQERKHLGRGSKHRDKEARSAQESEGKAVAAGGRKTIGRIRLQPQTRLASPSSTVPLLGPQFSLWNYFCTFLTQELGHDPVEAHHSLPCLAQGWAWPKPEQ